MFAASRAKRAATGQYYGGNLMIRQESAESAQGRPVSRSSSVMRGGGKVALVLWAAGMLVVTASLMVGHWVELPHPSKGVATELVSANTGSSWHAFHFLYGDCPCSRRVLKRIVERNPLDIAHERIVLIGHDPELEKVAHEKGYDVDVVTAPQLKERYGVESAPLLMVIDAEGVIRYSGGYTSRKQGLDIQDDSLIRRTVAGEVFEELPLYGCAVSKELKAIIDPFGLK